MTRRTKRNMRICFIITIVLMMLLFGYGFIMYVSGEHVHNGDGGTGCELITKHKEINSQAIADAFANLSWQVQCLTERILCVNDALVNLSDVYNRVTDNVLRK